MISNTKRQNIQSLLNYSGDLQDYLYELAAPKAVKQATDGTYNYYGFATPGTLVTASTWKVMRETIADGTITWANGNAFYINIWNNYATLTYS